MIISNTRRIVGNAVSLLTSDVVNRATTFVLYALIARYLGAFKFGQMSLALTFFYTFQIFAGAGLKTLITREIARDKTKTNQYFINGCIVGIVSSLLSIILLLVFVWLMNYAITTATIILLLSLGLLPYSLSSICEAVFQAWEKMYYITYASVPVNVAKVGLAGLLLAQGYDLYHLIILLVISHVIILGIEGWLMFQHVTRPRLSLDPHLSLLMVRSTSTFLGIDGFIAIMSSLNIILLSKLTSETEVGLYSAVAQLMVPVTLIYQSIVLSIFPVMCRKFEPTFQSLKWIAEHLIALLLVIALPTTIGLFFLADPALLLLYGEPDFLSASGVLQIMVWTLVLIVFTSVLGQVLVASLREKITLRIVVIDTLVGLVFGLILINQFGLIGAAATALLTKIVDFVQHYVPVSRLFGRIALARLIWKPAVASLCMAVYLALLERQEVFLTVMSAGVLYIGVLFILEIWSIGGPRQLKARYLYLWIE